jgi:hypothetical protein
VLVVAQVLSSLALTEKHGRSNAYTLHISETMAIINMERVQLHDADMSCGAVCLRHLMTQSRTRIKGETSSSVMIFCLITSVFNVALKPQR